MFNSARWWSDKNRYKAVFKLQFHAAQLEKAVGDALIVSLVPADTGKPSLKSGKAVPREGRCLWENAVYVDIKFNRDPKSGKIQEKKYYLTVGTGKSKNGVVGEASIDFSCYAKATKVSLVSLSLEKSQTKALLNVSIQRIQETVDQRDVEEYDDGKSISKDTSLRAIFRDSDAFSATTSISDEDLEFKMADSQISETNAKCQPSSESDGMSSSESSSGNESLWESHMNNQINQLRPDESLSLKSKEPTSDALEGIQEENQIAQWEWIGNSAPEASTDDSSSTPREIFVRQHSDVVEGLKFEVSNLSRQAEMSDIELQTLRKQIVKESKRGQDLSREIVFLKQEKEELKVECEKFKSLQRQLDENDSKMELQDEGANSTPLLHELRQEVDHAKELNVNLQIQLHKMQESNAELILAVRDLEEMLEQKNQEISNLSNTSLALISVNNVFYEVDSIRETDDEQKALEEIVNGHNGAKEACILMPQMMDLRGEIETYMKDKDELELQMEQLALDYEIILQENHGLSFRLEQSQLQEQLKLQYECSSSFATAHELEFQIENLENELHTRTQEFTNSLVRISELEVHAKCLEEELQKQAQIFDSDLESVMCTKVEQEQRAIRAEETLRKTRRQTAIYAERLQEEFRRLSIQFASTFEANEKITCNSLVEANELRVQKAQLEEMLQNAAEKHQSLKNYYEARLHQLSSKTALFSDQIEQMQSEINDSVLMLEKQKIRKSTEEMEFVVMQLSNEKAKLEGSVMLLKNESRELWDESNKFKYLLEKKDAALGTMKSELDSLQDQLEKESLRKQVQNLEIDLKRGEMELKSVDKTQVSNCRGNNESTNVTEMIKFLEGQIMLKETALETSSKSFLEKERELHSKIGELEQRLEFLSQKSVCFLENNVKKLRY